MRRSLSRGRPGPRGRLRRSILPRMKMFRRALGTFRTARSVSRKKNSSQLLRKPPDPVAWMGLAASYDRLRRFDLADRAYAQAEKLEPANPVLYNNRGYSYLLRGNVVKAREYFLKAQSLDPDGAAVTNNLHLLSGSRKHIRRHAPAY